MTTVLSGLREKAVSSLDSLSPNQQLLPLTAITNERDRLEIGGCDVVELVEQYGSPLYILDEVSLRTACQQYRDALIEFHSKNSKKEHLAGHINRAKRVYEEALLMAGKGEL